MGSLNRLLAGQDEVAQKERTMGNTPKNKYSEVQRIVKEGLTVILVEVDYILEEQELTELSHLRLNQIKRQTERIGKAMTEIVWEETIMNNNVLYNIS